MKILLLTQYFPPEFGACAARCSEHAAIWAAAGHEVEICTALPNYPEGVIREGYRHKWFVREERDGYTLLRSWIYAVPNRVVWKRALSSLSFTLSALLCGVFLCRRPDVIIASSGPFFMGPLGYALSLLLRRPYIFEVRDILPQQAVDVGMLKNPLLIKVLTLIEEALYRRASMVVTVANASRLSLIERGAVTSEKCVCIENGIREDFFTPARHENQVREEHGWSGQFVAMYIGIHGVSQGLGTLLETANLLRNEAGIRFVFVGDGAHKPALEEQAERMELRNVEFIPPQAKERMPLYYAAADVCFVPLRKGNYFEINIPSKIFESLACARPIILGARGQARDLITAAQGGVFVEPEDASGFAEAVLRLRRDSVLRETLGQKGRQYVVTNFSRHTKATVYLQLMETVSKATRRTRQTA